MIKILIVDDHAIVRQGLKQILADISDMEVFAEAGSGDEALKLIRDEGWGIMLLDIAMPGKNVMELIKLSKQQSPHLPILILSMYPEDQYAIRMLRAGADGYLTKESAPEQLVAAIRKVAKGGKYISPAMTEKLIAELNPNQEIPPHTMLTDREFQVFSGICAGKSITDLAQQMALSVKTISTYRTRLMKKMNMSKNAEIIHYAFKNDLLD
ncbi:response regulator transcription factor [Methylobacter sp.]|uniref:response regulator n=1 Tax=Methylobacter sp. TaxID=2051955 RepID=UPI001201FE8A|nr:response regulator transcription factor [Methylobacter sp.]TAK60264.1 MAG: response regulator transcription factor [Methylobacter sp.]